MYLTIEKDGWITPSKHNHFSSASTLMNVCGTLCIPSSGSIDGDVDGVT